MSYIVLVQPARRRSDVIDTSSYVLQVDGFSAIFDSLSGIKKHLAATWDITWSNPSIRGDGTYWCRGSAKEGRGDDERYLFFEVTRVQFVNC